MIPIGWSAGDIATACVILFHVIKALDTQKGASKQYRDSHVFLCGLYRVVLYVSDETRASSLPEDAQTQIDMISAAYLDFHAYILKHTKLDNPDKNRLKQILPTVRWGWNELNNKVQSLKMNSLNAIAIMETLIVMDLSSRVNTLLQMGDRQEQSVATATTVLHDVREQLSSLSQVSEEYHRLLDDLSRTESAHMDDLQLIEERLDSISRSQDDLQENLNNLMKHLEERAYNDQAQQEQWKQLLESRPEPSIYDKGMEQTQADLRNTKEIVGGVGELTGNAQIQHTAVKVQGASRLFDALSPLKSRFGFGKSGEQSSESNSGPQPRMAVPNAPSITTERRVFKPAPPVTTPPPPRRIPMSPIQPPNQGQVQMASHPRPLPPQRSSARSDTNARTRQTAGSALSSGQLRGSIPSSRLTRLPSNEHARSPPALPPRRQSENISMPPETTLALTIVETRPALPPRTYSIQSATTAAESSKPALPPKKPQHLCSASYSPTARQDNSRPPVHRVSSTSSSACSSTFTSLDSVASSTSTTPSTPPKSPFFAELVKTFEAKKVADALDARRSQVMRS